MVATRQVTWRNNSHTDESDSLEILFGKILKWLQFLCCCNLPDLEMFGLSTQVYKWVPVILMLGVTLRGSSIPSWRGGEEILLVASCHRSRQSLWATWLVCLLNPG